jgi:hypothetical protein
MKQNLPQKQIKKEKNNKILGKILLKEKSGKGEPDQHLR